MRGVKIDTVRFFNRVKVLMMKGERGERPSISETPIDNGFHVSFGYEDGEVLSFDLTNATSGNYSQLTNKPSINGVLLSGNKNNLDLGIFKFLTGTINNIVGGQQKYASYDGTALRAEGIDDLSDYAYLGVITKYKTNASDPATSTYYRLRTGDGSSGVTLHFNPGDVSQDYLSAVINNDGSGTQNIDYIIVLIRVKYA